MTEEQHSEFERRAAALLKESVDSMDAATRSRLTQARHAALAGRAARPGWLDIRVLAPGGAVAAAAVIALVLWGGMGRNPVDSGTGAFADLDLLADSDAYELSQETDLEFIEWAAAMGEEAGT
jgi:hypothetical protein